MAINEKMELLYVEGDTAKGKLGQGEDLEKYLPLITKFKREQYEVGIDPVLERRVKVVRD